MQNLIGQRFERLVILKRMDNNKWGQSYWLCRCDCGKEKEIRGSHLRNNLIKSCGCFAKDINSKIHTKHGHNKKGQRSKTYKSWRWMIQRCINPKNNRYNYYGGRGIKVCKRWMKFENFLEDMKECPSGYSIDRKNNNKNYCKSNCRWATPKEQGRNKRNNRLVTCFNKTQCLSEWAEETGIPYHTLRFRINKLVWSAEKSLTTPVRNKRKK